jgi:hypothetical protein
MRAARSWRAAIPANNSPHEGLLVLACEPPPFPHEIMSEMPFDRRSEKQKHENCNEKCYGVFSSAHSHFVEELKKWC